MKEKDRWPFDTRFVTGYSWTTSVITCVETMRYHKYPFFYVATDDGILHVRFQT